RQPGKLKNETRLHSHAGGLGYRGRDRRRGRRWKASVTADEVDVPALVVVVEVGQVIAEVGEVVAGTDAEVLADVAIHARHPAVAGAAVVHVEPAVLDQAVPLVRQLVAQLAGREGGRRIEPVTRATPVAHFAFATRQLGRRFPAVPEAVHA